MRCICPPASKCMQLASLTEVPRRKRCVLRPCTSEQKSRRHARVCSDLNDSARMLTVAEDKDASQ